MAKECCQTRLIYVTLLLRFRKIKPSCPAEMLDQLPNRYQTGCNNFSFPPYVQNKSSKCFSVFLLFKLEVIQKATSLMLWIPQLALSRYPVKVGNGTVFYCGTVSEKGRDSIPKSRNPDIFYAKKSFLFV